ncbi:glycosyltransferase [Leptospira yasudae]|nr:glycosyltransferase [Leptospira yasudae]
MIKKKMKKQNNSYLSNDIQEKISLLIPAYNEELTIAKTIEAFSEYLPNANYIIIDNNSKDQTYVKATQILQSLNLNGVVLRERRQGKGIAIRTGFAYAEGEYFIMVDADLTYPPSEVFKLLQPIIDNEADMVVGDRISNGTYHEENKRLLHNFGNFVVTKLINSLFSNDLKDIMSGYRAFNRKFIKNLPVLSLGFELETEITLHALDKRFRIKEVPISYKDRPSGSFSKLNTIRDGIRVLRTIAWIFKDFRPFLFFSLSSLFTFTAGLSVGFPVIYEFVKTRYILHIPSAILATGLITISLLLISIGFILDTVSKYQRQNYELHLLSYREK